MHKFIVLFMLVCVVFAMLTKADDNITILCEKATIKATEIHWRYVMGEDTNLTNSFNVASIMRKECAS